jgi:hypothetical protein
MLPPGKDKRRGTDLVRLPGWNTPGERMGTCARGGMLLPGMERGAAPIFDTPAATCPIDAYAL